jgi:hypothetical protein
MLNGFFSLKNLAMLNFFFCNNASYSVLGPEFISPKKKRQSPIEFRPTWGTYNKQYYSWELVCYIVWRTWSQAQRPFFLGVGVLIVWSIWSQAEWPKSLEPNPKQISGAHPSGWLVVRVGFPFLQAGPNSLAESQHMF